MTTLTSVKVESKSRDGKSIKVNGQWYKAFNASQLKDVQWKDTIDLTYTEKHVDGRTYYNIQGAPSVVERSDSPDGGGSPRDSGSPTRQPEGFPVPLTHSSRSIVRQNSLTNAVKTIEATHILEDVDYSKDPMEMINTQVDLIIAVARRYEEYSCGDIERRAAETVMSSSVNE